MFPFPHPPSRTTTPPPTHPLPPPTAPLLNTLYTTLLRPTLLPAPQSFTQPLLDNLVIHHDPLLEDATLFTVAGRLREVGVEVDKISRDWGRRGEAGGVQKDSMLVEVRRAGLRCRLQNVGICCVA